MARPVGDAELDALAAGEPFVVLLDVDGTLAPIAPRPEDARVPPPTREVLKRLAALPGVHVALVSGRTAVGAYAMAGVERVWTIGNHGVERRDPDGGVEVDPRVLPFVSALARARDTLEQATAPFDGVLVEDKRWSLSLHYRLAAREIVPAVAGLVSAAAAREGLRVVTGKEVLELRAPVDVDKGTAVMRLLHDLGADPATATALYVGDDVTDEDAFRRLAREAPRALTVRVGHPGVTTDAARLVPDPEAVRLLLTRLADVRQRAKR